MSVRAADFVALHRTADQILELTSSERTAPDVPLVDALRAAHGLAVSLRARLVRMNLDRGPLHWPAPADPPTVD